MIDEAHNRRESDRRLDRIEAKLDQVADALQSLARTEEKLVGMDRRVQIIEKKMETGYDEHVKLLEAAKDAHMTSMMLDRLIMRVDVMEEVMHKLNVNDAKASVFGAAIERALWIVFSAIIGSAAWFGRGE